MPKIRRRVELKDLIVSADDNARHRPDHQPGAPGEDDPRARGGAGQYTTLVRAARWKLRLFDHAKKPDKKANKLQMMKNLDRNLAKEGKAAEVLRAEEQAQDVQGYGEGGPRREAQSMRLCLHTMKKRRVW